MNDDLDESVLGVLLRRSKSKVSGIHARRVVAGVADYKPVLWLDAPISCPGYAVREIPTAGGPRRLPSTIAFADRALPYPAHGWVGRGYADS